MYIITIAILGLAGNEIGRYLGVYMKRPESQYEMPVAVILAMS